MAEAKKNERTDALKEVKRLCKEFGFTAGMLKGALADGRQKQWNFIYTNELYMRQLITN